MKRITRFLLVISLLSSLCLTGCRKRPAENGEEVMADSQPSATEATKNRQPAGNPQSLSIYYAGHPAGKREKDFVQFLEKHFNSVKTGDLAKFDGSQSDGFDVTILDYDGDGFESPRPRIPSSFTRPVVTMGVTGAFICGQRNLKTDYL